MNEKNLSVFPIGEFNNAFSQYFVGQSYLNMLSTQQVTTVGIKKFSDKHCKTGTAS